MYARLLALLLVATAATACGDAEDKAGPYVAALVAELQSDDGNGTALEPPTADCFARAMVDALDADALDDAGVTPDELAAEADALSDLELDFDRATVASRLEGGIEECGLLPGIAGALMEGTDLFSDNQSCVADALAANDALAGVAAQGLVGVAGSDAPTTELSGFLAEAVGKCPEALTELVLSSAELPISDQARACVGAQLGEASSETARAIFDQDRDAFVGYLTDALAGCPEALGDVILASAPEGTPSEFEACARRKIAENAEEAADVIGVAAVSGDGTAATAFGQRLGNECVAEIG
ncbi:MAG: hypothetical protein ACT4PW_11125 [Acidimicrobiia bacterium]